jgi:hypothetical protein
VEDVTPPAQPEPKPEPARPKQASPAPAAQAPGSPAGDTQVWDELVQRLNGKLDLWVYPMLTSGTQCLGQLQDKTMTIHLFSPLVKTILNTPSMVSLLQEELYAITGDHIQVAFTDGPVPAPAAPDTSKLDALSKFSNITFE